MNFRIGFGIDIHQFKKGEGFVLGGVKINCDKAVIAHSDGDVLIHAICDSLLGAAGLKDIGYYFPDNSTEFENIDSRLLLKKVVELISEKGYIIGNIDTTVCLQKPKISSFIDSMKAELSKILKIDLDYISIKATTTEKLGYIGEEKGIKAYSSVLIYKK